SAKCLSARAKPTDAGIPCPSGPVVTSTPDVTPYSGCPGVWLPHCRKPLRSSIDTSKPDKCNNIYCKIEPWPAAKTNRSRLAQFGSAGFIFITFFHSVYAIGADPIGIPG